MPIGTLNDFTLNSTLLSGTPIGTNPEREFVVYQPHGYQVGDQSHGYQVGDQLPCLFYLPGFGSNHRRWTQKDFPMYRLIDLMILEGKIPPCLVVCIDGTTPLGGGQYVDSKLNGPFAQHVAHEILPFIEKHYGSSGPHAIAGHSSGGFGALQLASLYPEKFSRVGSFGGDLYFEITHKSMLADFLNDLRDGKIGSSLRECLEQGVTHYILGLCAAYSPNLDDSVWSMDFPIDPKTAMMNEDIWQHWLSFDPLCWTSSRLQVLKKMDLIYLSAGLHDECQLHLGAQAFEHRCRQEGINVHYDTFDGKHSLLIQQMEAGLIALLRP
jgi:enterochelin esterase-like enzyme